jgi:DNA polymerase
MLNEREKQESIEVLNYQIRSCRNCILSVTRKHALTGEGNIHARIMIVALSPGVQEDLNNRMFIGPSGRVLNKLFLKSGTDRESVFMTNLVKCMLPGNRKPKKDEIESCSGFLNEEISIIQPEVIVPLGYYAARAIVQMYHTELPGPPFSSDKIEFGKMLFTEGLKIYPLSHPAALLYNPSYETDTIEKYKKLKAFQ